MATIGADLVEVAMIDGDDVDPMIDVAVAMAPHQAAVGLSAADTTA